MTETPTPHTLWKHKKRGTLYVIICVAQGQCNIPSMADAIEGDPFVVYKSYDDNTYWCRPLVEFIDGRFERVNP